jgi:ribosomal protein L24
MNPIFISFYSGDIYYENCSKVLYNKCKSLGIEIEIERSIHISNVMLFDSKLKKGVRIGFDESKDRKERVSRGKGK